MGAETRLIPTITEVNIVGNQISILTYYNEGIDIIRAFITDMTTVSDGVSFIEGEGGISTSNVSDVFALDSDDEGNLIVIGENAAQFSLDEDTGQLVQNIN